MYQSTSADFHSNLQIILLLIKIIPRILFNSFNKTNSKEYLSAMLSVFVVYKVCSKLKKLCIQDQKAFEIDYIGRKR